MEETRSAVLKRRISELEPKNEQLEQDNKKLKQECECYEVKQLKQGMEELHAALKPRFFLWFSGRNKNNVYDEKGILISCGKDVCDCMDDSCPGCHFPCPKCRSNKCGNECRQNRKWMFESVELDGNPNSVKYNPYAKDLQIPPTKNKWSSKHYYSILMPLIVMAKLPWNYAENKEGLKSTNIRDILFQYICLSKIQSCLWNIAIITLRFYKSMSIIPVCWYRWIRFCRHPHPSPTVMFLRITTTSTSSSFFSM